jgi:PHS family inorganic phosphate transporter-like MFS transporter
MLVIIAAEYSSTVSRATMLASIFLMQSLGRILVIAFSLAWLQEQYSVQKLPTSNRVPTELEIITIDRGWRFVTALGGISALLAFFLRLKIPESPRYPTGIVGDLRKAARAAQQITYSPGDNEVASIASRPRAPGRPARHPVIDICISVFESWTLEKASRIVWAVVSSRCLLLWCRAAVGIIV